MGEDESEVAEFDYSTESDEQVPWENTQPFKPDENPFLAEPEKQKTEKKEGSLTGGASSLDYSENTILNARIEKLMYPDEIAGVKRSEPKTFEQMTQQDINPNYFGESDIDGIYSKNCQCCTVAAELIIRGYNVVAAAYNTPEAKEVARIYKSAYLEPVTGKECIPEKIYLENLDEYYDYINNKVNIGERYEFGYNLTPENAEWSDTESHVVLITKDSNGKLRIYDPQDGSRADNELEVRLYIQSNINEYNTEFPPNLLRIDDKALNMKYVNALVKKKQ